MSADNWTICPKCKHRLESVKETERTAAARAYGGMPMAEWEVQRAAALEPVILNETLREDYEIGVTGDGEFYAIYKGQCTSDECDFGFKFDEKQQAFTPEPAR